MPIVTNPTAGDVHVNRPLTNFSQMYLQREDAFVAMDAWPNMPSMMQSDLYYEFDRGDFYRDEAEERTDGTETQGAGFRLATRPYFTRVYGFHKDVTDRQRANQDAPVRLDQSATRFVSHKLLIRRERQMQSGLFSNTASPWFNGLGSAQATGTTPSPLWSAPTGDPIVDIRTAIRSVHQTTGYRPNKMLIGRRAYDTLLDNDSILARITGGSNNAMPAMVMRQLLAALFELDAIYVMDSVVNTGPKDTSATLNNQESNAFIGGDDALVYYAPDSVGLEEPTAAVQFSWTGLLGSTANGMRIKRFRMENLEADRIEGQMAFDFRLTSGALGFLYTSVSA